MSVSCPPPPTPNSRDSSESYVTHKDPGSSGVAKIVPSQILEVFSPTIFKADSVDM